MVKTLALAGAALAALALIAYGTWLVYPPAAPIAAGGLVWLDLHLLGAEFARRNPPARRSPE